MSEFPLCEKCKKREAIYLEGSPTPTYEFDEGGFDYLCQECFNIMQAKKLGCRPQDICPECDWDITKPIRACTSMVHTMVGWKTNNLFGVD